MTKEERHAHWRDIIEGQRTSGMTIAAYCHANQVPTTSFYTIRRRFMDWLTVHCAGQFCPPLHKPLLFALS
jgi:hypothetical protein